MKYFGLILLLALTGCESPAPAVEVVTIEPTPDPVPSIAPVEPEPTVALPSVVSVAAKCQACGEDCHCDVCCCDEAVKVNGVYHRRWKGTLFRWEAVRCYGPDKPCDYEWRAVNSSATPKSSAPACASGNCGSVRRYQPVLRWRR